MHAGEESVLVKLLVPHAVAHLSRVEGARLISKPSMPSRRSMLLVPYPLAHIHERRAARLHNPMASRSHGYVGG